MPIRGIRKVVFSFSGIIRKKQTECQVAITPCKCIEEKKMEVTKMGNRKGKMKGRGWVVVEVDELLRRVKVSQLSHVECANKPPLQYRTITSIFL